jgi:hypothetical protein
MTMSNPLGYDPANVYVWRVSDGVAIHLSLKVVTQIASQMTRGGVESRPAAIRGILLGRSVDVPVRTTVVEDFELIPAGENGETSNWDAEDALFEIACRMAEGRGNEQRVLGFFRVQRDGKLTLGPRDLQTFSRLFCETGNVALLIQASRRGDNEATLFYWQSGGPQPRDFGFGFPFDAAQLVNGHPGWRYPDPLDSSQPAIPPPPPKERPTKWTPPTPVHISHESIRWSRLVPTAVLVVAGIAGVQFVWNSNRTVAAEPPPAEAAPLAPAGNETPLGLRVTSRPHELEIRWNREGSAIAAAERGTMSITEAGTTQAVPIDQRELRDGYVAYTPTTADVNIRFEVTGKDGNTTTETIRAVAIP